MNPFAELGDKGVEHDWRVAQRTRDRQRRSKSGAREVGREALHVLRVARAADRRVQLRAAVGAGYLERMTKMPPHFIEAACQQLEIRDHLERWSVVDAALERRFGSDQSRQSEVAGQTALRGAAMHG